MADGSETSQTVKKGAAVVGNYGVINIYGDIEPTEEQDSDRDPLRALPVSQPSFVGREEALSRLIRMVDAEVKRETGQRPIALVGMGGMGKTSLAHALIRRIVDRYPGGMFPTMERPPPPDSYPPPAKTVFRDWADALDEDSSKRELTPDEVRAMLDSRYEPKVCLIDDVFSGDLTQLRMINDALPETWTRLLTTRDRSVCPHLGAQVYRLKEMKGREAKRLLADQLHDALDGEDGVAAVDAAIIEHDDVLTRFVAGVDGLPLALSIGIGSVQELDEIPKRLSELLDSLESSVDEFDTMIVDDELRNASLARSLSVSLADLKEDGQSADTDWHARFRALGVFPAGCELTHDNLTDVWADEHADERSASKTIRIFRQRNLLDRTRSVSSGSDTSETFQIQPVVRAYAAGLIANNPAEFEGARRRYQRSVVERAKGEFEKKPELWTESSYWYPHVAHVVHYLIATLCLRDQSRFLALAAPDSPTDELLSQVRDSVIEEDLDIAWSVAVNFARAASRLGQRLGSAALSSEGETQPQDERLRVLEVGLVTARLRGDEAFSAEFLSRLGSRYSLQDSAKAEAYFSSALRTARSAGDENSPILGAVLSYYAESRRTVTDWEGVMEYGTEALDIHRTTGNERLEAKTLSTLGEALWRRSEFDEAEEKYDRSRRLFRRLGDQNGLADILNKLASVKFNRGQYHDAIELFEQAYQLHSEFKDQRMQAEDLNDMGACYRYLGEYAKALGYFQDALELNQLIGNRRLEAFNLCNIAGAHLALENFDEAETFASDGRRLGADPAVNDLVPQLWGYIWEGLSWQFRSYPDLEEARDLFERAVEIGRRMDNPRGLAGALGRLGILLIDEFSDDAAEGLALVEKAIDTMRSKDLGVAFSNVRIENLEEYLGRRAANS